MDNNTFINSSSKTNVLCQKYTQYMNQHDPYHQLLSEGSPQIPVFTIEDSPIQNSSTTNFTIESFPLSESHKNGWPVNHYSNVLSPSYPLSGSDETLLTKIFEDRLAERQKLDQEMATKGSKFFIGSPTLPFEDNDQIKSTIVPHINDILPKDKFHEISTNADFTATKSNNINSNDNDWPELSIDNINTSFKIVFDLQPNYKMKIVDKSYLAPDTSYVYMLSRYWNGVDRNIIIDFLEHLVEQTTNQLNKLIADIKLRTTTNVISEKYKNINILNDIMNNLSTFLHNYQKIKDVYKSDSSCCARFDNIYQKFNNLHSIMICNMTQ